MSAIDWDVAWVERSEAWEDADSPRRPGHRAKALSPGYGAQPGGDVLQRPLGRRHASRTRVRRDGGAQRLGESLEHGLRLMVRVLAAEVVDVQRDQGVVHEPLEKFVCEVDVERTDHRACERNMVFEPGTAGQVEDHPRQRLV